MTTSWHFVVTSTVLICIYNYFYTSILRCQYSTRTLWLKVTVLTFCSSSIPLSLPEIKEWPWVNFNGEKQQILVCLFQWNEFSVNCKNSCMHISQRSNTDLKLCYGKESLFKECSSDKLTEIMSKMVHKIMSSVQEMSFPEKVESYTALFTITKNYTLYPKLILYESKKKLRISK